MTAFRLQKKGLIACVLVWFMCWGSVGLLLNGYGGSIGKTDSKETTGEIRNEGSNIRNNQSALGNDQGIKISRISDRRTQEVRPRPASRQGRLRRLEATAYSYTGSRTASGTKTSRGVCAIDPKYFLFGTTMFVEGYGWVIAEDSGRLIKGDTPGQRNRKGERLANLDLFFSTEKEAVTWGRRVVKVWDYGTENDLKPEYLPPRMRIN